MGGGLERSELGAEITTEVRRWLIGETTGAQCSQVVLDRALTVLSNFKLASGCQLEVLGGPLGAIVGGYSDADWLNDEVFSRQPADAILEAFILLGFSSRGDGDWSSMATEEVSLAYRRMCLRSHPSRGGAPRAYLKLQVAMELIRAFAGEAGPLESMPAATEGFVLSDLTLVRELQLSAKEAEEEATRLPQEQLEEMNRALDEYILRQMCFKSEIVDEIARLHENSAYAILGVSSGATDEEIKKAYKLVAMQCHPDKGGDKEDFQELNNAYERIMEQRRATHEDRWSKPSRGRKPRGGGASSGDDSDEARETEKPKASKSKSTPKGTPDAEPGSGEDDDEAKGEEGAGGEGDEDQEVEGSDASLIEKAARAAEEASRYAKTAAEFAHQAADAAETARQGREQGSHDSLTKSIAHSAIVLTLTVVKAVRVVGYATLDAAAQCRLAAKRNPSASSCAERSVSAMSLGLEALNAALACAEVTETTAAELQAPATEPERGGSTAAAERFVGAAVRASLAAASASNAAMSAAIAAVEGSRQCMQALSQASAASSADPAAAGGTSRDSEDAAGEREEANGDSSPDSSATQRRPPTKEEAAAAVAKRLVAQRNNNHKVLQRLNAEILSHQQNVRAFLQANRQLIPEVSGEEKSKVAGLLRDYAREVRAELASVQRRTAAGPAAAEELLAALGAQAMLVPFLQPQNLAIPISVKARVLKMAALYDLQLTTKVLDDEVFNFVASALAEVRPSGAEGLEPGRRRLEELRAKVRQELCSNVAEEGAEAAAAQDLATAACPGPSPENRGAGAPAATSFCC